MWKRLTFLLVHGYHWTTCKPSDRYWSHSRKKVVERVSRIWLTCAYKSQSLLAHLDQIVNKLRNPLFDDYTTKEGVKLRILQPKTFHSSPAFYAFWNAVQNRFRFSNINIFTCSIFSHRAGGEIASVQSRVCSVICAVIRIVKVLAGSAEELVFIRGQ